MNEGGVIVREEGRLGHITLDRPHALNALTLSMIRAVRDALDAWEFHPAIDAVLLDGSGRGLCAGGDVRAIRDAILADRRADALAFVHGEYALNWKISRFRKPMVALMDGITMGGGIGISVHSTFRLVTERSALAMPEVMIGLFPDVGTSLLFGRLPDERGTHLALTGDRFGAGDAIALGFADAFLPSGAIPSLIASLRDGGDRERIGRLVAAATVEPPPPVLDGGARTWIARCYGHDDPVAILLALDAAGEPAAVAAAAGIRAGAPLSVHVTLRALRAARRDPDLARTIRRDAAMAEAAFARPDFVEGVRAALVDRDRRPSWNPSSLEAITVSEIDAFFRPPGPGLLLPGADSP